MVLTIRVPGTFSAQGLETLRRDRLLTGDNGGVRFLFDHARRFSWPKQAAPANGDPVYDLAERANGSWQIPAGQALTWKPEGAVDFAGFNSEDPATVAIPASVAADLWADQRYLVCTYMRLPTAANWYTPATGNAYRPYVSWANGPTGYAGEPDIVSILIGASSGVKRMNANRQRNGSTGVSGVGFEVVEPHFGKVAQIGYWRTATEEGLRLRTSEGSLIATIAASTPNTGDFSAKTGHFGITGWWSAGGGGVMLPSMQDIALYRGFVENLARSGRDPVTVLDGDWTRHAARFP